MRFLKEQNLFWRTPARAGTPEDVHRMNYAFLPDLLALAILVFILSVLRRRHPQPRADLWLLGLLVTLIEAVAHTFYPEHVAPPRLLHVIVVDGYLLAGLIFVWASGDEPISRGVRLLYLGMNGLPLLVMNTLYGLQVRVGGPYVPCVAAGFAIGVWSSLYLRRSWRFALSYVGGWIAIAFLLHAADYRSAVYWSLCCVYAIAALNFKRRLPNKSTGRLAIVTGFTIWSLCLVLHPWIVAHYGGYADIASHVWNMQKSLISIGMILVMLEEQISSNEWLALHDELTGLPNRRLFAERLTAALEQARSLQGSLAMVILDLNGFKAINDRLGHQAGDLVLREVAANLRKVVRTSDTLARLGGDEFILLAADTGHRDGTATSTAHESEHALEHLVETVRNAVERPIVLDGQTMMVSASLGLAIYPDDAEDATRLLRVADQRMYALKARPVRVAARAAATLAG